MIRETSEHVISDHFVDANEMISLGSGNQREMLEEFSILAELAAFERAERRKVIHADIMIVVRKIELMR